MSFVEERLPLEISMQSSGGPGWSTTIVELDSGDESRNQNWSLDRGEWDVGSYLRSWEILQGFLAFFNARRGKAIGFRFQDPFDYKVVAEPFGTGGGGVTQFQLTKTYTSGSGTYVKNITKPIAGLSIYDNGTLRTLTTDYTVDTGTGIVTFLSAPTSGHALTWSGTFDKPVRFDIDKLNISYADLRRGTVRVPIIELKS